ncbi:MAG: HAMP domain-containing sensor histidine kinase [Candidatus Pacebacteria bacterium]|nr:HAMP domain-containing sensor histidine kinase [Candidatus Paceibacterota bacterium]
MNYALLVDGKTFITGNSFTLISVLIGLLVIVTLIEIQLWRKRKKKEVVQHEFISIIAHKFRTPLTQVKWLVETALTSEKDAYKQKDLKDIKESNDKLIVLMETLISLTNNDKDDRTTYELERTDIYDFVHSISEEMRPLFQEKNISFSVQSTRPDLAVKINRTGMKFVIQALLHNSYAYSHPGREVRVIITKHFGKIRISFIDSGIGIEAQDLSKVFSKFYRSENAERMDTEGFGVSLFISTSIVSRNNGSLRAYSAGIEQGSVFRLTLPRIK